MNIFYFLGDSITLGVNVAPQDNFVNTIYHGILQKFPEKFPLPPTTLYNLGVRKNSTKNILDRFDKEFQDRNIPNSQAYFILMCGVVDMAMPQNTTVLSLDESKKYFKELLINAKEKGKVFVVNPSPVSNEEHKNRIASLIPEQEKICQELQIPYINIFNELNSQEFLQDLKDGIHPSQKGNAIIANKILNQIFNFL